jgi:DNA-directed RNA polymerase sigma subunit (sigma70/sigma32)
LNAGSDEELVARWQRTHDIAALNALRTSVRPLIISQVNKYRTNAVPTPLLEAEADRLVVEAAGSFRPTAGASFRTYAFTALRHLNRFSAARSNIATIPEARAQKIGLYQRVNEDLMARKNRAPSPSELADELMWPLSEVMTMQRSLRRDIASPEHAPGEVQHEARIGQLMHDIRAELTPDELRVYDLITRQKVQKGQDLARRTGFSQAKVSVLRTAIARKMERWL